MDALITRATATIPAAATHSAQEALVAQGTALADTH